MLKAFGAFLLTFCVLSLLVQAVGLGMFFGGSALLLFVIDVVLSRYDRERRDSRHDSRHRATVL